MQYKEAVREFEDVYVRLYIDRVDYWTGHLAWSEFVDGLHREWRITDKQRNNWGTPFPYAKRLEPNKRQLERYVYENN